MHALPKRRVVSVRESPYGFIFTEPSGNQMLVQPKEMSQEVHMQSNLALESGQSLDLQTSIAWYRRRRMR